ALTAGAVGAVGSGGGGNGNALCWGGRGCGPSGVVGRCGGPVPSVRPEAEREIVRGSAGPVTAVIVDGSSASSRAVRVLDCAGRPVRASLDSSCRASCAAA